jgi:C4-dicarboxylate transporter DctM subunit
MFASIDSASLLAIPFFILAGNIMASGGIARRIAEFMNSIFGRFRGGMAIAVVLSCAMFAALSGSGPATVVAIGSTLYPEMIKQGYNKSRSAGLIAIAGGLGPIIPPSIAMVVYANTVNASISNMFKAGTVVGIIMAIALMITVVIYADKEKWPKNEVKYTVKDIVKKFYSAIPALMMPLIILGGIFSGKFTPTEAACISVVLSVLISIFIYKEIKFKDIGSIVYSSAVSTVLIELIITTSSAFSYIFTTAGFSKSIVNAIVSLNLGPAAFVALVTIVILIFGVFMETLPLLLLFMPILWPIAQSMGIDIIYFGMVVTVAGVMGAMTPPVAVCIFASSSVSKLSVEEISKGEVPFFITMLLVLILVFVFPQISLLAL